MNNDYALSIAHVMVFEWGGRRVAAAERRPGRGNPCGRITCGKSVDQALVEFFLARDDFKVLQWLGICPAFLASMLRSPGRHQTAPG